MRFLVTGDSQASPGNLPTCKVMVDELESLVERKAIDHVLHLGDFKDQYNPIDVRVLNFAVETCSRIPLILLKGNHDRISLTSDDQTWLPALRKAGADVIEEPTIKTWKDGTALALIPYMTDPKAFRRQARRLASRIKDPGGSVLGFHQEIRSCQYNVMSRAEDAVIRPSDLKPARYMACVGGHIHLRQRIGKNIWYVGSPFATDWGEANQRKGYLIVDTERELVTLVHSSIPGWYDPSWPRFKESKPKTWKGTRVRIHVPADSSVGNLAVHLDRAKRLAEKKYKGATVVSVPTFPEAVEHEVDILEDQEDSQLVRDYVEQTVPEELADRKEMIIKHLAYWINQVDPVLRAKGKVKFVSGAGKNFLTFKDVEVDFTRKGITLVSGRNKDVPGTSNGAGKSNFLQLIPVALFGRTFKGQTTDRWTRRRSTGTAYAEVSFIDPLGRNCTVYRSRRPTKVKIEIDGEPASTGNTVAAIQKEIQRLTGYTWQTLANTMYIDQKGTDSLLSGTNSQRMELLERFQNSERFAAALKLMDEHLKKQKVFEYGVDAYIGELRAELKAIRSTLDSLKSATSKERRDLQKEMAALKEKLNDAESRRESIKAGRQTLQEHQAKKERLYKRVVVTSTRIEMLKKGAEKLTLQSGICPVCLQKIDKQTVRKHAKEILGTVEGLEKELEKRIELTDRETELCDSIERMILEEEKDYVSPKFIREQIKVLRRVMQAAQESRDTRAQHERKMQKARRMLLKMKALQNHLQKEEVFTEYCRLVLSKNGLPAYLNTLLVPRLNKSAEHYAKLFMGGALQIRYEIAGDKFDIQVVNPYGGEELKDQSVGEEKLLSLVTAFSLRDTANSCNVLVCDEPGDGLDEANAGTFSRSLKEISKTVDGAVYITSHRKEIIAELASEHHVEVVKESGISTAKEVIA